MNNPRFLVLISLCQILCFSVHPEALERPDFRLLPKEQICEIAHAPHHNLPKIIQIKTDYGFNKQLPLELSYEPKGRGVHVYFDRNHESSKDVFPAYVYWTSGRY